jgi:hypothetical protein
VNVMDKEELEQESPAQEKLQKNAVQEVLDVPLIGDAIGLIIGLLPPLFLAIYILPNYDEGGVEKIKTNLLMSCLIFVWTSFLYFILNVKIVLPLIPIPLFVIGILGVFYQLFLYFSL